MEQSSVSYPKPAGFWIRVVASLVDTVVFIPIVILNFVNYFSIKSIPILLLISIPGFLYKPLMESFYGATLGKMACGIKVTDENGEKLTLKAAYIRFIPMLLVATLGMTFSFMLFMLPEFKNVHKISDFAAMQAASYPTLNILSNIANLVILIDCIVVAFTKRKRAIHDFMAGSYCVYK